MSFKNNKLNESEIISNLKASWSKNASTLFYIVKTARNKKVLSHLYQNY